MRKILLISLYSLNVYGMCNFPHNPAVYCIEAKVSNLKKYSKSKEYSCVGELKLSRIVRPKNTYSYNNDLDIIEHKNHSVLKIKDFKNKTLYATDCDQLKGRQFLVIYSCYDKWAEFEDFTFLALDKLKRNVIDPWKQRTVNIDCETALLKRGQNE